MSHNTSNLQPGDEASNLSSVPAAMNPSIANSSTSTPTPGFNAGNADAAAANGAQASSSSTGARDYPQFSAATEMILRRMRGEPTGEFDPTASPNVDGYEEAKAKVMMGMKTTMNMDMGPAPQGRRGSSQRNATASRAAASRAASRNASSTPVPVAQAPAPNVSTPIASGSASASAARAGARSTPTSASRGGRGGRGSAAKGSARGGRTGGKRKRQVKEESESAEESEGNMSGVGDGSSDDGDDGDSITNMPSMTSSGRQIQKPKNFNPVAMEGPPRKRVAQKKVQEHSLCKKCSRGHSPQSNMIVFCDGCNMGWHQMCHDPVVSDEVVKDESSEWFCAECTKGREENNPKPSTTEPVQTQIAQGSGSGSGTVGAVGAASVVGAVGAVGAVGGIGQEQAAQGQQTLIDQQHQRMGSSSGNAGKMMDEKRAYLSSLPHPHLVAMLIHASTLHPDLNALFAPAVSQNAASGLFRPISRGGSLGGQVPHGQGQQQYGGGNQVFGSTSTTNSQPQRRTNIHPQQPFPTSMPSGLFARAEANPSAPINFIRKIPAGGPAGGIPSGASPIVASGLAPDSLQLLQQQQLAAQLYGQQGMSIQPGFAPFNGYVQQGNGKQASRNGNQNQSQSVAPAVPGSSAINVHSHPQNSTPNIHSNELALGINNNGDEAGDTTDSRESTPASPPYPRPGNGLMRKLPPDDQDLEWLEDKGDYEAFSHVVYDSQGRGEKIEEDGKVVAAGIGGALGVGVGASAVVAGAGV